MRKIRDLIKGQEKIYIILRTEEIGRKFMLDAEKEGFAFFDGTKPSEVKAEDKMVLYKDGKISFLGLAGRMKLHYTKDDFLLVDYEEFSRQ